MTLLIDGATRLFAIIGDPVSAVRSPEYFNKFFVERGINAALVALHVAADDLPVAWAGIARTRNIAGLVVTMPHKVAACALVDRLEPTARLVGAINAARRDADGRWVGDMFDGQGVVDALLKSGHDVAGRKAFLLGAGGAGAAIAAALAEAGVGEVVIQDVDSRKRDAVIARLAHAFPSVSLRAGDLAPTFDFAINATPLGMKATDPIPFDPVSLPRSTIVVDVITKPEMTPLLERARVRGNPVQTGREMHEALSKRIARFFGVS